MANEKIVSDPAKAPIVTKVSDNSSEKPKQKKEKSAKSPQLQPQPEPVFPREAKVNKYGFLFLDHKVQEAWGVSKGKDYPVKIELTAEGDLLVKKP